LAGSFSGTPTPQLQWLRNGKPFGADARILLNKNFNSDIGVTEFMLEILKFTPAEHAGGQFNSKYTNIF
jgi:hypothetical protein